MYDLVNKAKNSAKHSYDLFIAGFHTCKSKEELVKDIKDTRDKFSKGTDNYTFYNVYLEELQKLTK